MHCRCPSCGGTCRPEPHRSYVRAHQQKPCTLSAVSYGSTTAAPRVHLRVQQNEGDNSVDSAEHHGAIDVIESRFLSCTESKRRPIGRFGRVQKFHIDWK